MRTLAAAPNATANDAALAAVVIPVPRTMFTGADAELRLADVQWLAPRAAAHEAVVLAAGARATVLPLRFGAVFSSAHALDATLTAARGIITEFLAAHRNAAELTLRVEVDLAAVRTPPAAPPPRPSGAAYLSARKAQITTPAQPDPATLAAASLASSALQHTLASLAASPAPPTLLRLGEPRTAKADGKHITRLPVLLAMPDGPDRLLAAAHSASASLASKGITVSVTGPWPLYSFTPAIPVLDAPPPAATTAGLTSNAPLTPASVSA